MARPFYDKLDWTIITATILLATISLLTIYSASSSGAAKQDLITRQAGWFALGFFLIALVTSIDYRIISALAYPFYGLVILALSLVLVFGEKISGAQRWIKLGNFSFQPSELAKIALILVLAKYFADKKKNTVYFTDLLLAAILLGVPMALILKEPDLGMAALLFPVFAAIVFVAGLDRKYIVALLLIGVISTPVMWMNLKEYQKDRLVAFINPDSDPLGAGYHVNQSMIAIGSGGFWGKGFMNGTQSQLNFLPEQFTDFIFSVFSEEWGFIGSFVLLSVYLVVILKGLTIASKAKDKLGRLIAVGVVTVLVVHMFVNVGVTSGIMPVTGLTLPFVSYGGSSIFSTSIALGLLLNVSYRRFDF
ncbi:rod shape-determining protein RodA [candidate division KSB3 bacterium]|uniref:Peptidoglycan glycosyltransferase RodA n=1 Tax=candidate division KSB3 bacterium TaxID=2044937 RepID=A0A9D5K0T7_9BACT|nr:rod shape-determining protein RodA [candidate division KSB3 bacterium]MBD3327326.1 rod shape-determining protein RodA [candidate division KSB3 bacterium]